MRIEVGRPARRHPSLSMPRSFGNGVFIVVLDRKKRGGVASDLVASTERTKCRGKAVEPRLSGLTRVPAEVRVAV
jgi:hypothetical protein